VAQGGRAPRSAELRNTVDALPVILRKDTTELFSKYRVYSERELQSRYTILSETYVKTVNIEGQLTSMMARTMILPAALRYQGRWPRRSTPPRRRAWTTSRGRTAQDTDGDDLGVPVGDLDVGQGAAPPRDGDAFEHAKYARDKILPSMNAVRTVGDRLETMVATTCGLAEYREMLFIK